MKTGSLAVSLALAAIALYPALLTHCKITFYYTDKLYDWSNTSKEIQDTN